MIGTDFGCSQRRVFVSICGQSIRDCGRAPGTCQRRSLRNYLQRDSTLIEKWQSVCKTITATMTPAPDPSTILVAEDQEHVREAIAMLLRGHGYSVVLCASPSEALAAARAKHARPGHAGHELPARQHLRHRGVGADPASCATWTRRCRSSRSRHGAMSTWR